MYKQQFLKTGYKIKAWLKRHNIENYELVEDEKYGFKIIVSQNVSLEMKGLRNIPVKFEEIRGNFNCSSNKLTSLEFAPSRVTGNFDCSMNALTSLDGAPSEVENFYCSHNKITSLKGGPKKVENFLCDYNAITDLLHAPKTINGGFSCAYNAVTSLEGLPEIISSINCAYNRLETLEGCPTLLMGSLNASNNLLVSLQGCPEIINGRFDFSFNPVSTLLYFPRHVASRVNAPLQESWGGIRTFEDIYALHVIEREKFMLSQELKEKDQVAAEKINKI